MIKTRIAAVAMALSFIATAASFAANPHMGTWKLNEAKTKLPSGMGKNTTVTYAEQKDKIKVTVDGVDKDGKPTHSVWLGKFDGKTYPVKGNLPYNSVAYKVVNERTNDITAMKDGKMIGRARSQCRRMANRAQSPLTVETRTGRSSKARLSMIRDKSVRLRIDQPRSQDSAFKS